MRKSQKDKARKRKLIFRAFMLFVVSSISAAVILRICQMQGLFHVNGSSYRIGSVMLGGGLLTLVWKFFEFFGGNALWDAIKAVFAGGDERETGLRDGNSKSESKILDCYQIEKIPFDVWKLHSEAYVEARAFANEGSDRIRAELELRKLVRRRSALIALYSAASCGRQALVAASLDKSVCPVFMLRLKDGDLESVRERIVGYMDDFQEFKDGTFYVRIARTLSSEETQSLMKLLKRTISEAEDDGRILRVIVSFNCLETLQSGSVGLLFHLAILDSNESDKFLAAVVSSCVSADHPDPMATLRQTYRGARLGRIVHAYSQGNPIGVVRFVKAFLSRSNKFDSPLVVKERGWQKQTLHLGLTDRDRSIAQAILHFILAISIGDDIRSVDIRPLADALYGGACGNLEYAKIQAFISVALSLPENPALNPFDFRTVSYDELYYDSYVFSCGNYDYVRYPDAWQSMYSCILTHPKMKEYREAFCTGLVTAAVRTALSNALPYQQSPGSIYGLIDSVILGVLSVRFEDEQVRRDVEGFVEKFQNEAWQRVSDSVIEHLAHRFDSMMPEEILNVIREDLAASGSDDDYLWRLGELLPFMAIGCPDPVGWCIRREDVSVIVDRMLASNSCVSADVVCAFCWLLEIVFGELQDVIVFEGNAVEMRKWEDCTRSARTRAAALSTPGMKRLLSDVEQLESRFKGNAPGNEIVERWRGILGSLACVVDEKWAPCLLLACVSSIGCAGTLLRRGDVDSAGEVLEIVQRTIDANPLRLLSVRRWFLPNILHGLAVKRTLRLPDADSADALDGFYRKMCSRMDEISARYGFDGENRPRFLIDLASSVDALLSRYRAQKDFEDVLSRELHAVLQDVVEVKDAVNYRDLMRVMALLGRHLHSCSSDERDWFIKLWDELDGKIPGCSGAPGWLSRAEVDAFIQCAGFVMNDPEFASRRFTGEFLEKVGNSVLLGLMTDNAKLAWAESLFPSFGPHDMANISVRLARIALGEGRIATLCETSGGEVSGESLLRSFIESRGTIASEMRDRTDAVFDSMVMSVAQLMSNGYFNDGGLDSKHAELSAIVWVVRNYVLPLAKEVVLGAAASRPRDVANLSVLLSCLSKANVASDRIPDLVELVMEASAFLGTEPCRKIVFSLLGGDLPPSERAVNVLESIKNLVPLEQLGCIANMALVECPVSDIPEFNPEFPQFARQLYQLAVDAFVGLSTDALLSGGYALYDSIIENLFAQDCVFLKQNPDLVPELLRYVQSELSKRRKSKEIARIVKIIKKAVKSI